MLAKRPLPHLVGASHLDGVSTTVPDDGLLLIDGSTRAGLLSRRAVSLAAVAALVVCTGLLLMPSAPSAWNAACNVVISSMGGGGRSGAASAPHAGPLRVAVLLSGMPRFVDGRALAGWKAFLAPYKVDVYAHFWFTTGDACNAYAKPGDAYATGNSGVNCFSPEVPEQFTRAWAPFASIVAAKYEVPPLEADLLAGRAFPNTFQATTPYRTLSLYTSMMRAQQLLEEELAANATLEYDWVIRGRTDLAFTAFPDLARLERGYCYFEDEGPGGPPHPYDEWMRNEVFILAGDRAPPGAEGTRVRHFPPGLACAGCAAALNRVVETVDANYLDGVLMNDEHMMFAHVKRTGLLSRMRGLEQSVFAVAISRDGVTPDTAMAPAVPYAPDMRSYRYRGFLYEGPPPPPPPAEEGGGEGAKAGGGSRG